ncbi:hypothetical protein BD779DRAFT_1573297, partial [Infundibulicybe gibba]
MDVHCAICAKDRVQLPPRDLRRDAGEGPALHVSSNPSSRLQVQQAKLMAGFGSRALEPARPRTYLHKPRVTHVCTVYSGGVGSLATRNRCLMLGYDTS